MDFELLTCLLKFIEHFPDYHSVLSRMLLRFSWTTFIETAVYSQYRYTKWYAHIYKVVFICVICVIKIVPAAKRAENVFRGN